MIGIHAFCLLSFFLLTIGMLTVLLRKNLILMFLGIELMLSGVNLSWVSFASLHESLEGQISVFFVIITAAAESAIGLGLMIALYRNKRSSEREILKALRE